MNREIKFRAWDNHDKKWLLGYEYPNLGGFSLFGECMLLGEWESVLNRFILQQKDRKESDLIVMQFTGLKDKNGKEIYEGDILRADTWKYNWIVQFDKIKARFNCIVNNDGSKNDYIPPSHVEVIGNIYENPELLK